MSFRIRDAVVGDAPALASLHVRTFQETHGGGPSVAMRQEQWQTILGRGDPHDFTIVVEDDAGALVAFARGKPHDGAMPGFSGELNKLYVLRRSQGSGLGRLLVGRVAERFLGLGVHSMLLFGDASNPSNGFYEHLRAERLYSAEGEFHGGYGWRDLGAVAAHRAAEQRDHVPAEPLATTVDRRRASLTSTRVTATLSEATVVLGVPVGLVVGRQAWVWLRDGALAIRPPFTDARLLATLGAEVVLAILLGAWLRRRNWSPNTEIGRPAPLDILRGGVLWIVTFAVVRLVNVALGAAASGDLAFAKQATLSGDLSLPVMVAALIINPLFEEMLWLGYAIPTLSRRLGVVAAAALSIGLRVTVHGNQSLLAVTSILPVAVVWTAYYMRSGRLWPVVVAHVINNAIGFSAFIRG